MLYESVYKSKSEIPHILRFGRSGHWKDRSGGIADKTQFQLVFLVAPVAVAVGYIELQRRFTKVVEDECIRQ